MTEIDLIGDARSATGHAAYSMRGIDDRWVVIQKNTFKNWVNEELKDSGYSINSLETDLFDGIKLCALVESLQKRKIGRVVKKPINHHQYLENVTLALQAMKSDEIKLVNIGSEDIVNGNMKLILGMIWRLILRYQIGKASKVPPKKLMLSWLQAVIPDLNVTNFTTDWNDGVALHALLEYCKPGTCPNWRKMSRLNGLENCRHAMQLAKKHFDIPLVVTPENFSNPDLDELSGMTYLSYYMKMDSPGYNATLRWAQNQIPQKKIKNFQQDWNDGTALTALIHSLGGTVTTGAKGKFATLQDCMDSAKRLGVEPVISPGEMASEDLDHLGVMAYVAWFQNLARKRSPKHQPVVYNPESVQKKIPLSRQIIFSQFMRESLPGNVTTFTLETLDQNVRADDVTVEVIGPTTKPRATLTWHGTQGHGHFTPQEGGIHKVFVYNKGELVYGCPEIYVKGESKTPQQLLHLLSMFKDCNVGTTQVIRLGDLTSQNVKVEARSPSGRVQELTVSETHGTYTTNFTPSEVGDWSISILYDGIHIQGSPFNVRVYDAAQVKVFGLEGGAVGKAFSFSADVSGAGQGELAVEITHNGRSVPCSLHEDTGRRGLYRVTFTPDGPGIYTIRVYFAGMEITGSPYTLEIVDSSMVTASGEGLSTTEVNRRSSFIINTHGASGGDIKVSITSPRGQPVNSNIFNQGDGTYRVEYVVTEAGEYLVDVAYAGRSINGSPFKVSAVDANRIVVSNLQSSGQVGRLVEFDIDAAHAGSGNLEIMVNDGTIPCSVQNRGNRQFHASFSPKEAIAHKIQMKFNGKEVPGSPWRVDIRSPVQVSASGVGLQMINVRQPANVDIKTNDPYSSGVLASTITSPTGRIVPNQIFNNYNGNYRMEYSVQEVGNHNIEILYDGAPISGSPFVAKAYDPSAIVIGNVPSGVVGKPVEFTIDVTQAGEGQLEIMVNRGSVPNTVKMLRKGVFLVSFVPREPRQHVIEIKFNGELLPRCPINVPILDASRVTVQGDGIRQVAVNKHSSFRVSTAAAGEAELDVRVTAPNGQMVPAKMVLQPDGDYKVEYSSRYTGRHMVEILWAGQPIMGSPFYVEIYDPNKIRVDGVKVGTVGERMTFDIIRHEAGKAELGLTIVSPSGKDVPYDITPTPLGERVTYVAHESGPHHIYITYGGLEVPGCPMTQNVQESGSVRAFGDGLFKGEEDKPATFYVDTQGKRGDLFVQVDGPNSIAKCNIEPERSGRYVVTYVPVEVGLFNVQIKWNNREIEGSPFRPKILDPRKIHVIGGWQSFLDGGDHMLLNVGETKLVKFDCSSAGPGTLSAEVKCPNGQVMPVDVYSEGKGIYVVSFVVRQHGDHYLSVKYGEMPLPRSPYYGATQGGGGRGGGGPINIEKVVLTGRGLQEASVGVEAEFVIDGTDAGPGTPEVSLKGIKTDIPVQIMELGQNKYRCVYNPQMPGGYLLTISWSGRQVRGSPFKVNVTAVGDATKVQCAGEGLKMGIMGREIKSVIDTRRAGPGELTAQCRGPTKVAYCELFDHQDGTFTLNIKPQEVGKHTLQIKYDGDHVPGSPYTLRVSGAPDASKVKCYGPGIEDGVLHNFASHFIVETRGAGAGQLTVRVRGPKGAFRVEMRRESQKDRTIKCQYDPIEVGDYIIHCKWSGEHVPGSPFRVQIFDTQEELERARQQKQWSN